MKTQHSKNRFGRLFLLVFSSTIIAEVLSGSTTLSRIQFLPMQFLVYGSAAVLIREISRRLNAGWPTIILLGLAFGLTLEGLALQLVFNPNFLTNNLTFGRSLGTNWVWIAYMPPFHAFFSICIPILLCEVIFDDEIPQPWASRTLIYVSGIVLLLMLIALHFLFIKLTNFSTGLTSLLILFGMIVLIVCIALKVRSLKLISQPVAVMRPSYHFWLITAASLTAAGLWYLGFDTIFMANKPAPWIALASAPVIVISYFILLNFWSMTKIYTAKDRLALGFGLLAGEMIFGYFATVGNPTDHYAQLVFMFIVVALLSLLYIRVDKRIASDGNYKYASKQESNLE